MLGFTKKANRPAKGKKVKPSRFPHIDAMTSSQMKEYSLGKEVTVEEYAHIQRRLAEAARA